MVAPLLWFREANTRAPSYLDEIEAQFDEARELWDNSIFQVAALAHKLSVPFIYDLHSSCPASDIELKQGIEEFKEMDSALLGVWQAQLLKLLRHSRAHPDAAQLNFRDCDPERIPDFSLEPQAPFKNVSDDDFRQIETQVSAKLPKAKPHLIDTALIVLHRWLIDGLEHNYACLQANLDKYSKFPDAARIELEKLGLLIDRIFDYSCKLINQMQNRFQYLCKQISNDIQSRLEFLEFYDRLRPVLEENQITTSPLLSESELDELSASAKIVCAGLKCAATQPISALVTLSKLVNLSFTRLIKKSEDWYNNIQRSLILAQGLCK